MRLGRRRRPRRPATANRVRRPERGRTAATRRCRKLAGIAGWTVLLYWPLVAACDASGEDSRRRDSGLGFRPLAGVFEPSGIAPLPDGRFLVVEDEAKRPFALISFGAEGIALENLPPVTDGERQRFDDLEAVARSPDGSLVVITSHSRTQKGKRQRSRERLARLRFEGSRLGSIDTIDDLRERLADRYPALERAAKERKMDSGRALEIEGLAFDPDSDQLLVGLRTPLVDGRAIVVVLGDASRLFDGRDPDLEEELTLLDLDGGGIRGLAYDRARGGFLILAKRETRGASHELWFWQRSKDQEPRRARIEGLADLHDAEGLTTARVGGRDSLLIVSDDGKAPLRPATYALVPVERLIVER